MYEEEVKEGDKAKMPLMVFEDSMKDKSNVKFKGLRTGVVDKLYKRRKRRKRRERSGGLLLLGIDEYNTSKVGSICTSKIMYFFFFCT